MSIVVGIDEVGRGCWAGPLVAAAVILHAPIEGLKDSKLLSKNQREALAKEIYLSGQVGLGWVAPAVIDEIGLTAATTQAMTDAIAQLRGYDDIVIDGAYNFLPKLNVRTIIGADRTVPAVSAASIVAKVARDAYMTEQSLKFPGYSFEKHVGYGTAAHLAALKQWGVCELHRLSYKPIQAILEV